MNDFGGYDDLPFLAELYDLVPIYSERRDVEFYVDLCRRASGTVLELGCGTGRVLIPIAAAGTQIVGLDASPHMLSRCRANLSSQARDIRHRVRLVQASMTDFHLAESFATVIMPFRPFQHLVRVEDQIACLECVHAHLGSAGILVFDVFQVDFARITDPWCKEETEDVPELVVPDGRRLRRCNRIVATHPAEQYNEVEIIYYVTGADGSTERLVQRFPFRYFFRYEIEHLLGGCGFHIVEMFGDFDRSPFSDTSPEMIFVAQKAGDARKAVW